MQIWRHKALMLALGLSVIAEGTSFAAAWLAPEFLFRLFLAFHRPALTVAGLLVPELYEDDPNISTLEGAVVWGVLLAGALLQWFVIFLGGAVWYRHFCGKRHETVFGV